MFVHSTESDSGETEFAIWVDYTESKDLKTNVY